MKDIQLSALGNGLVDLQYDVPFDFVAKLGYETGNMILVEPNFQAELIQKLDEKRLHKCSGGSAANTIIAFSGFGGKAAYKTILGNDFFGKFYAGEFEEMNIIIQPNYLDTDPTGTCLVLITPDSERTMLTSLGATAKFMPYNVDEDLIKRSEWFYVEGYEFSQPGSTEAIFKAVDLCLKHNTKIAVTFSDTFITEPFRENLARVVQNSDLIFCNEAEAKSYTKTTSTDEAFEKLTEGGKNLALTLGVKGSRIKWAGKEYTIPVYPAKPIDATGAGDVFAAGFLFGIIDKNNPEIAGHLGSIAAAKIVSQYGARLIDDYNEILDEIYSKY